MANVRTFESNIEAFEFACDHLDNSFKNGQPVLGIVLAVQGRMCSVKLANSEDKSVPDAPLTELLARADLKHVCFSAMLDHKVDHLTPGGLVLYTTMPELAAAGKTTVAGTVISKAYPHYSMKTGWQVRPIESAPAPAATPPSETST